MEPRARPHRQENGRGPAPEQATILVVDDRRANLLSMAALLEPLGRPVVLAQSGEEALIRLLHERFAVILMDVRMPGLDGLETARLIKSRERTRHIPIIFVTAQSSEADEVMKGYLEGAVDYLMKPVNPNILLAKVRTFVELFEQGEQLRAQAWELAEHRLAQERARRDAELQRELLAIVGHDLRSPLATIQASAHLLLKKADLDEQARKTVERVLRAGQRMRALVDQLVDFTKARLGTISLHREPADLREIARQVVDDLQAANPDRTLALEVASPAMGHFDVHRVERMLENLLENAIHYGSATEPITTRVWIDDDLVRLSVHNHGPPIPPAMQERLFEPYQRASDQPAGAGLGLGLYIVREVARAHGGDVEVHSVEGMGTTFTVSLPTAPASVERGPAKQPDASVAAPPAF